jgi:hypothetical protein
MTAVATATSGASTRLVTGVDDSFRSGNVRQQCGAQLTAIVALLWSMAPALMRNHDMSETLRR